MMKKLGVLVGEKNWTYFRDIYKYLSLQFTTSIFELKQYNFPLINSRLNRWKFKRNLGSFLKGNEICFFEWASDLLSYASHMPKNCKIITRLHSFELFEWAPKINWQAVDRIILVSKSMQRYFCELYPDHASKTVVIYNGILRDEYSFNEQKQFQFNIGMLANVLPIKRIYEMILTQYEIKKLGFPIKLFVAGKTEEDKRYTLAIFNLIEKLGIRNDTFIEGFTTNPSSWLQKIDIFVSNSFWEGQQVALLEAMASGCFCLSHRWSGVEEILPDENLFITSSELQEKILEYSSLPEEQKLQIKRNIRLIACEQFDLRNTIEKIIHEIKEI